MHIVKDMSEKKGVEKVIEERQTSVFQPEGTVRDLNFDIWQE